MTSPSIVRPAQRHRPSKPVPAPRRAAVPMRLRTGLLIGTVITGLLGGCTDDAHPVVVRSSPPMTSPASAPPSSVSAPSPAVLDEQQRALAQYQRFWSSLTPISKMLAAQRGARLAAVVINPELSSLVAGMSKNDQQGQVFYGAQVPHPRPLRVTPDGGTAVVDDCQDSSHTGLATRTTMTPVTVGVPHNHVVVTMKRASNDLWKIAFVSYTKTPC